MVTENKFLNKLQRLVADINVFQAFTERNESDFG